MCFNQVFLKIAFSIVGFACTTSLWAQEPVPIDVKDLESALDSIHSILVRVSELEQSPDLYMIRVLNDSLRYPVKDEFETSIDFERRRTSYFRQRRLLLSSWYAVKRARLESMLETARSRFEEISRATYLVNCRILTRTTTNDVGGGIQRDVSYNADQRTLTLNISIHCPPLGNHRLTPKATIPADQAQGIVAMIRDQSTEPCKAVVRYTMDSLGHPLVSVNEIRIVDGSGRVLLTFPGLALQFPSEMQVDAIRMLEPSIFPDEAALSYDGDMVLFNEKIDPRKPAQAILMNTRTGGHIASVVPARNDHYYEARAVSSQWGIALLQLQIGYGLTGTSDAIAYEFAAKKSTRVPRIGRSRSSIVSKSGGRFAYPIESGDAIVTLDLPRLEVKQFKSSYPDWMDFLPDEDHIVLYRKGNVEVFNVVTQSRVLSFYSPNTYKNMPFISLDRTLMVNPISSTWLALTPQIATTYFRFPGDFLGYRFDYRYNERSAVYDGTSRKQILSKTDNDALVLSSDLSKAVKWTPRGGRQASKVVSFLRISNWPLFRRYVTGDFLYQIPKVISKDEAAWFGYPSQEAIVYDIDHNGLGDVFYIDPSGTFVIHEHDSGVPLAGIPFGSNVNISTSTFREHDGRWTITVQQQSGVPSTFTSYFFVFGDSVDQTVHITKVPNDKEMAIFRIDFDKDGRDEIVANVEMSSLRAGRPSGRNLRVYQWRNRTLVDVTSRYLKYVSKKR